MPTSKGVVDTGAQPPTNIVDIPTEIVSLPPLEVDIPTVIVSLPPLEVESALPTSKGDSTLSRRSTRKRKPSAALMRSQAYAVSMTDAYVLNSHNRPLRYSDTKTANDRDLWLTAESTELRRLLTKSNTMKFIPSSLKPSNRKASYYNPQVKTKTNGDTTIRRVRGTYGGDVTDYIGDRSATTADLQTLKTLLNGVISDGSDFMTLDLTDFYLESTLEEPEYMWIKRSQIPPDIQEEFKDSIVFVPNKHGSDSALVKIDKDIYGLPQAGRLAQIKIIALLKRHGYYLAPNTSCLFKHKTNSVVFTLVVDDFAVKYKCKEDVLHLLQAIKSEYDFTVSWDNCKFLGMAIEFEGDRNSASRTVSISMPGYVEAALKRFQVTPTFPITHAPAKFTQPIYGAKIQYVDTNDSPALDPIRAKFIQEVVGVFLYYSRAIDPTMFTTLNKIASEQASPTEATYEKVLHFLQYAAHHPNAKTVFHPSDMILIAHADASYLSETKSRSRAGGILFFVRRVNPHLPNGAIDVLSSIITAVVSSACEAEYAALFIVGQACTAIRNTLSDLGYPQPPTRIICDNATACGIANRSNKVKRSKSIDMRWHWIRDRVDQQQFNVIWRPGSENLADYFTKTHPIFYYKNWRSSYVVDTLLDSSWTTVKYK